MRRLFWLGMGMTIGALLMRKVSKLAAKLTPGSIGQSVVTGLSDLAYSVRDFASDVREAMTEREAELRESTGLNATLGSNQGDRA